MVSRYLVGAFVLGLGAIGCGGDTVAPPPPPPPSPQINCGTVGTVALAPGDFQVVDPAQTSGCVRVPTAGAAGAEYIVVAASTASVRTPNGVSGGFVLRSTNPSASASAAAGPPAAAVAVGVDQTARPSNAARFDALLRSREVELSRDPSIHLPRAAAPAVVVVPQVGDVRTFKTCANLDCTTFNDVAATARFVGTNAAIYMDNSVPQADTLQAVDYQDLGRTFDSYHHPIDTTAFGAESDVDTNGRVVILMTDAVNSLTPDCANGRVLGYFFGLDLTLTGSQSINSNKGEIFYTLVPSPATPKCTAVSRSQAIRAIKPTLIHEFQHMISWNQHVLIRNGNSEETWLNEGFSHFAEELGGRLVPNSECIADGFTSCRSQYISGDIINSYDYARNPEAHFLVAGSNSNGTLEERGSAWLFLRWVLDQFSTVDTLGTDLTRAMLQTNLTGVANIVSRTGGSFSDMVPEWLLTIYLDDLANFAPSSPRLTFKSWGLRTIWTNPANDSTTSGGPFNGFPLKPDSTRGTYSRAGSLLAGSGRHLRLIQAANGAAIDVQLVHDVNGTAIDPTLVPRLGIARVR